MLIEETVTYLQMASPDELVPRRRPPFLWRERSTHAPL
jgi:hypothetical protein